MGTRAAGYAGLMTAAPGPEVTVVVATRNRWADLSRSLPRHEGPVVVVDNASDDGSADRVAATFPDVRLLRLPANRGAVARNLGVEVARTPYVAFADDDSWWAPGALARAAGHFGAFPRLGLLAARMVVEPEQRTDPVSLLMRKSPLGRADDLPGPSVLGFLACGAAVRRTAFLEAGGFDDVVFFRGEEERLALDLAALGWGLAYDDDLEAHHEPSTQRDTGQADVLSARNLVLTAVMRRPWPVVARTAMDVARRGPGGRVGLAHALMRAPRALRHRRKLPAHAEAARRRLDEPGGPPPRLTPGAAGTRRA